MPHTLDVPEWATEREEETIKRLNRNRRIRRGFDSLTSNGARKTAAYEKLARQEGCSVSTVRKVLNGER